MAEKRQWVSISYEEDEDREVVRVHALHPFGARSAAVSKEVEMPADLSQAITNLLAQHGQDIAEWAEEAAVAHRTIARNRGEDHNAPLEYLDSGPGISGNLEVNH